MADTVVLMPRRAVEVVCHEEQLQVWAHELVVTLGMGEFLRDPLSYDELGDLERAVQGELRSIIGMAFDHPEARTIIRKG